MYFAESNYSCSRNPIFYLEHLCKGVFISNAAEMFWFRTSRALLILKKPELHMALHSVTIHMCPYYFMVAELTREALYGLFTLQISPPQFVSFYIFRIQTV